ncbi:cell division protein ZapA [Marinospirillum sp.]|jgi:cell division protein ZapA|uniref:cell division protein ZapA n=1 Tax=Marinospirillum sp. TaxID=2183934 RepID=UPI002870AB28|nr:cell division protein ZapA [Marinospirillum sp.]MDR9466904.1 cell division protein ZapA [Marinospirillum sp.]
MSSDKNTTEITLLDRKYLIACPPHEQDDLLRAARHLNQKMSEIRRAGKILSMERLSIMAALNITNEMLQRDDTNHNHEVLITRLTQKLDSALEELDSQQESRKLP